MARISIVVDTVLTTCASSAGPTDTYVEVPDDVWRDYLDAQDAMSEAETALLAYDRPENRINPFDEAGWR